MEEFDAMKVIDSNLASLDAAARARVLAWVNSKFGFEQSANPVVGPTADAAPLAAATSTNLEKPPSTKKKTTSSKKKIVLTVDKDINLFPKDKQSAIDFAKEKSPTNVMQKGVAAIYYVKEVLGYTKVGVPQVAAFFKAVEWKMPSDLVNTLQQAGTQGWLDTASSDDIKITATGENLVVYQLPAKK